jgi:ferredoxin
MAHVITDACTKDGKCIDSCPADAIHPTATEAAFETATQLYISPAECMDCGACIAECVTDAIFPADDVPADKLDAVEKNAEYYK